MLRSLLPTTLALLLAPAVALAAPADAAPGSARDVAQGADDARMSADAPDQAERSMSRSKSSAKGDKKESSSKKKSGKKGSGSGASRPSSGGSSSGGSSSGGSSSGGSSSGSSGGSRDRDDSGREERRSEPPRPTTAGPATREGGERADRDGGERSERDAGDRGEARERDGSREAPESRTARPAPYGSEGAGRFEGTRAGPAAEPSGGRAISGSREFQGARPSSAPTTRRLSAGMPSSAGRPDASAGASGRRATSSAPANFRGGSDRMAVSGHGDGSDRSDARHADGGSDRGRDGRADAAERHGDRGSDAVRATHGSHEGAERHREAVRHARSTAAYHRSSAYYHRSAAARHHAWASARYARHGRWYHPGGWFRPYRPGYSYWYHGVFVYGPPPWHHHDHVVVVERDGGDGGGERNDQADVPERKVDRARTFAVGIRGGSYMGGYDVGGGGFGDAGLGIAARYRPVEAVGFEVSWMHHDQTWQDGSERVYQPLQTSVQLFGMPWTKVNPYVLAGVTITGRDVQDNLGFTTVSETSTLWGPHAGIGLELGVGKKASINFDVRYTGYLNKPAGDLTVPGAAQGNMGLNFYF